MTEAENVKKPNESEVQQKVGELADKLISYVNDSLTSVEVEAASMYGCNSAEELYEKLCYDKESIVVAALDDVICYIIADLTNMVSAYQKHHQSVEKKTSFQNVQKEGVRVGTYNRHFVINEYKSEEQRITRFTQKLKSRNSSTADYFMVADERFRGSDCVYFSYLDEMYYSVIKKNKLDSFLTKDKKALKAGEIWNRDGCIIDRVILDFMDYSRSSYIYYHCCRKLETDTQFDLFYDLLKIIKTQKSRQKLNDEQVKKALDPQLNYP